MTPLNGLWNDCLISCSLFFYRVSQIDDALRISVHIVSEVDLRGVMSERPELKVQQEDENEWFIGCIVFRKRGGR